MYNIYLQYVKKKVGKSSSSKLDEPLCELFSYKKDCSSCKERCEYYKCCREEDYYYSSYCWWRDRSWYYKERSSDYKKCDEDHDYRDYDYRDIYYYDDKYDYKDWKYCDQDHVYFVEGSSGSNVDELDSISSYSISLQSSSNSGFEEVAYIVIDVNFICYKYYCIFTACRDQKRYVKVCEGSRLLKYKCCAVYNALNPSYCICGFCSSLFSIYSQLFQYLKTCEDVKNGTLRQPTNLASLLAEVEQQTALTQKEENAIL